MKNNFKSIAFIYEPKFKSPFDDGKTYLVPAVNNNCKDENLVIVCCSPEYNGVYKWVRNPEKLGPAYPIWINKGKEIYYVPIDECEYLGKLEDVKKEEVIKQIKYLQKKWYNNEVKNRDYIYKKKPEWMLK